MTITPEDMSAIQDRLDKAQTEVDGLCNGKRHWTMSIPVQPSDSDEVIGTAFDDLRHCLSELELLQDVRRDQAKAIRKLVKERNHLRTIVDAVGGPACD